MLDGVFSRDPAGEVCFHEAALLTPEHWAELQYVLQRRVLRYFRRHGLLDEADAHGMLSWQGSGGFSIDASVRTSRMPRGSGCRRSSKRDHPGRMANKPRRK